MYLDQTDAPLLVNMLNADDDIAFIVMENKPWLGSPRWRAVRTLAAIEDRRYCLWHIPGPALLLPGKNPDGSADTPVENPWEPWQARADSSFPGCPFLGAGHPAVFWLDLRLASHKTSGGVGLSSFEWIGNRYKSLGNPAASVTTKRWNALKHWVRDRAQLIPRWGPLDGPENEIWAFPSALARIRQGIPRDSN